MLTLFKPKAKLNEHATNREAIFPTKAQEKEKVAVEVIKKPSVLEEFSAVHDTILNNAKTIINDEDRGKRLKSLGFHAQAEAKRFHLIEIDLARTKKEAYLAEKYDNKYNLRFITKEEVVRLASKFGLVLGPASNFIGDIPEIHLKTMESIKIDDYDRPLLIQTAFVQRSEMDVNNWVAPLGDEIKRIVNASFIPTQPFHIVSKLKDFNSTDMIVKGNVLEECIPDPDPIVLKPVIGGYLIVCAWGEEENIL